MAINTLNYKNIPLPLSAAPQYWFSASASGQTIVGNSGNNAIYGVGGDTLIGGTGDDTFYVTGTDQVIVAPGGGVDTIVTYWGGYTLPANVQNLIVQGDGAYGVGNSLDNVIEAVGPGEITLDGGGGNNVLIGGTGETIFVHSAGDSDDVIDNFVPGLDKVRLENTNLSTFAAVQSQMRQAGSDVALKLGPSDSVTFRNVQVGQFSAQDFMLPLDYSQLHMSFDDEFNSLSLWNGNSGTWDTAYPWAQPNGASLNDGELEWYINSGYAPTSSVKPWIVNNGILDITAAPASASIQPLINNYRYTSGMLTTFDSFVQTYGVYEISAKVPADQGLWEDFWLCPANNTWPPELDVMEINGDNPKSLNTGVHSDSTGQPTAVGTNTPIADASAGFHTYTVDWEPNAITWYFDGNEVFQTATPPDMHQPMYMLLNLAVGGPYGNPNSSTQFPANFVVNYVRAYATTAAPPVILQFSPATGNGAVTTGNGTTTADQVTLTGTAEGDSTVNLYDSGVLIGTASANGVGAWSFTTGLLKNGVHDFSATDTNAAANTSASSSALAVTVNGVVPTAPVISLFSSAGMVGQGVANANQVTLVGSAIAGTKVEVFDGSTLLGTTTGGSGGAWSFTTPTLSGGTRVFTAVDMDAAGNVSAASTAVDVTVVLLGKVSVVGNHYYVNAGVDPELKYTGMAVAVGEFAAWTPIDAVQTASGYDVAWKNTANGQYTVWTTDNNGNYTGNLIGAVSGNSYALESIEPIFNQDLNGDGTIGVITTVIQTDTNALGSTSLTEVANQFYLDGRSGSGPALQYAGGAVTTGEFGAWTPIGAVQTASGYDVAWKNAASGQYTVWTADNNGDYTGNSIGAVSGNSYALESLEPAFNQDLNGDGVIGLYATPGTTLQISNTLAGASGATIIGAGATLELSAAVSASVTFASATGSLQLDHSGTFSGEIFNFTGNGTLSGSDHIDLRDIKYGSVRDSYANGVLTVTDGIGDIAKLSFNGSYTLANFDFASDGAGGTVAYDPPAPPIRQNDNQTTDAPLAVESYFGSNVALFANYIASSLAIAGQGGVAIVTEGPHGDQPLLCNPNHA